MLNKPDPHGPPEDRSDPGSEPSGSIVSRSSGGVTPVRRHLRGVPSSRAYWELRADQMMNRIFDADDAIDLEGESDAAGALGRNHRPEAPPALPRRSVVVPKPPPSPSGGPRQTVLLLTTLGGVCMVSAVSTLLYLNHWNQTHQALQQERNLLLVERLRDLGPANPAPVPPPHASQMGIPAGLGASVATLPSADTLPPPPDEAWMEQLDQLPPSPAAAPPRTAAPAPAPTRPAQVLRVPVSPRLPQPAPAAAPPKPTAAAAPAPRPQAPSPLLVGVVGAPGQPGSAIFQVGSSSTSVTEGEPIGSSGWRLRSANGDTAVIERGGEVRQVSIGNGK